MREKFNPIKLLWIVVLACLAMLGGAGCGGNICLCGTIDPKTGKNCCQSWSDSYAYAAPIRICSGSLPTDDKGIILPGWIVTNKFTDSSCGIGLLNQFEWTNYDSKPGTYPNLESVAICADDIRTGPPLTQKYVATGFRRQTSYKCPANSGAFSVVRLTRYDADPNGVKLPSGSQITVCDGAGLWSSSPSGFVAVGSKFRSFDCDTGVAASVNAQVYRKL